MIWISGDKLGLSQRMFEPRIPDLVMHLGWDAWLTP